MQDYVQVKALALVEDRAGLAQLTKELMVRPNQARLLVKHCRRSLTEFAALRCLCATSSVNLTV